MQIEQVENTQVNDVKEKKSKVETYIGFAIRAGKYKIGCNACLTLKSAKLVIVCKTSASNSITESAKLCRRFNCRRYITTTKTLEELTKRSGAKVMAITDPSLAKAIEENYQNDLKEFPIGE